MPDKYLRLDRTVYRYMARLRSDAGDRSLRQLRDETEALGKISICQISAEQGTFLSILVAALEVRTAIEVGTFTGYSSICIARALPRNGKLITLDQDENWTAIARRYWKCASLATRIDLRLGAAITSLKRLEKGLTFDFAFIDAEKTEYDDYYELILPHVRKNGLILFDNMLKEGQVARKPITDPRAKAVDVLNRKLAKDKRIEAVLVPIADGIQICRKR
ncbi:MAG: SAM-dependent methyltransferase [Verrucomicrobia bacterium]|nr:MAG: SAM-dependent methyltransferase [Verrucomicrobiota bacterium]